MKHFVVGTVTGVTFTLLCFLIGCDSDQHRNQEPDGALYRGRKYLNLLNVLNTTEPLYLYYMCTSTGMPECNDTDCFNETYSCEHMRQTDLTNTTYNFTNSALDNSSVWVNTSYTANILQSPWPPTEMQYNSTMGKSNQTYITDMNLTYNEPDTYNCSVFSVTYPSYVEADSELKITYMYVRGPIPNGTMPPDYCQLHFFGHCYQTKPYNWNCSLNKEVQDENGEEEAPETKKFDRSGKK
uniref:Lipocalin n=1 Tax=Rhipicephalus zambeziensis TaxID=60191 RepID=A0A224Y7Z7_9ACAR